MRKCSTIGPRVSAGRKLSAPTRITVPSSRMRNVPPCTGNVPALGGATFFCTSEPANAMIGTIMRKRPNNISSPRVVLYQGVFPERPANALPLFPAPELNAYRISLSPCGPLLFNPVRPHLLATAQAAKPRIEMARMSNESIAILTSYASIFLPRYSGVRTTIRPAIKTASTTKTSIPYNPAPTPPKITSPSWMLNNGTKPPSAVNESCIELTAPQEASVVTVANSAELKMPNRTSFPSMLPPATPRLWWIGLPFASAHQHNSTPPTKRINIAVQTVQPCF